MTDAASDMISTALIVYLAAGALSVLALAWLLGQIGRAARDCPVSGPAARAATLGVVGAFAAIGLGVVAMIGAVASEIDAAPVAASLGQYGAASVLLGISFAIAASTLREALSQAMRERLAASKLAEAEA